MLDVSKVTLNDQVTRIEARCAKSVTVQRLLSMPNPFAPLAVCAFAHDPHQSLVLQFFLDSCRQRSANAALRLIDDPKQRDKYRRRLASRLRASWWEPEAIWSSLPAVIKDLGLFPESALFSGTKSKGAPKSMGNQGHDLAMSLASAANALNLDIEEEDDDDYR